MNIAEDYYAKLTKTLINTDMSAIEIAIKKIESTANSGNWIYTCGNGGSASTASHFVTDWGKMRWINKKQKFKAMCLSDNIGMLTAYGNDMSYNSVFSEAVSNYGTKNDLLILISGSGNSENVIQAALRAKKLGMSTISIVGFDGGKLKNLTDICVHYPVNDMQIAEDLHLSFGHIAMKRICD